MSDALNWSMVRRSLIPSMVFLLLLASLLFIAASPDPAPSQSPPPVAPKLLGWQAKRIARDLAHEQLRPRYRVVKLTRVSRYRWRVRGHEPGYLFPEDGPDITLTLVERRDYQLWLRDPFTYKWVRWL